MIKGVHDIYSEVLNMKISYEPEHWTSMDCKGVVIGLHWSEGGGMKSQLFQETLMALTVVEP